MHSGNKKGFLPIPLLLFLVVGALIRFYNIEHIIFYWDEPIHSIRIDYQPLSFVMAYNNASAFFALLVHFLLFFGKIEFMSRLPSALFGVSTILSIYFVGKHFFSKREGLIAAAFVAFSPFFIRYSQYARAYSTFAFFSVLSLYFFFKAVNEERTKFWVGYGIFTILSIYTHLVGFLLLPAYALFVGIIWLKGSLGKAERTQKKRELNRLKNFIIWTFLVILFVFLLYIPDKTVTGFFSASFERVKTQPSHPSASLSLIKRIFDTQMEAHDFYLPILLSLFLFGLLSSIKKYPTETLFLALYLIIPLLIFILINPRPVNIRSADRYFICLLPIVFLLIAKGATALSSVLAFCCTKIKLIKLEKGVIQRIFAIVIIFVLIAGGFNFKHYYINFWRLGSFRLDKDVSRYLQSNIKDDSLIFFDFFPASSLIMVVNPLTKDLTLDQYEVLIRDRLDVEKERIKLLVYKVGQTALKFFLEKEVGLWVVTQLDSKRQELLASRVENSPQIITERVKGYTVLHFKKNRESLADKLIQMSDIFLSLNPKKATEKTFRLWAARINLLRGNTEIAFKQLDKASKIVLNTSDAKIKKSPSVFRILDRIFGLDDLDWRRLSEQYFFNIDMAHVLFAQGNQLFDKKEYEKAYRVYVQCANLNEEYNLRVSNRFLQMGNSLFMSEDYEKAILFYGESLRLNPQESFTRFLLAEVFRRKGSYQKAEEEYLRATGVDSLSPVVMEKIRNEDPLVIIWRKNLRWHIIFRAGEKSFFSGRILASQKMKNVKKRWFLRRDSLKYSETRMEFSIGLNKRIKSIEFDLVKKGILTFDLKIDGLRTKESVLLLNKGSHPENIPFAID